MHIGFYCHLLYSNTGKSKANPCDKKPCHQDARCRPTRLGGFKCMCPPGKTGKLCNRDRAWQVTGSPSHCCWHMLVVECLYSVFVTFTAFSKVNFCLLMSRANNYYALIVRRWATLVLVVSNISILLLLNFVYINKSLKRLYSTYIY